MVPHRVNRADRETLLKQEWVAQGARNRLFTLGIELRHSNMAVKCG
jgi:hypothetical protein